MSDPSAFVLFCPSFVIDDVDAEASELFRTDPGALTLLSVVGVCSIIELFEGCNEVRDSAVAMAELLARGGCVFVFST